MDERRDVGAGARGRGQAAADPLDTALDTALHARLERVAALASGPRASSLHRELLDELRALVREAEGLHPGPLPATKEVVERPARRLHGT